MHSFVAPSMFVAHLSLFLSLIIAVSSSVNRCISPYEENQLSSTRKTKWAIVALAKPSHTSIRVRNEAIASKIKPFTQLYDFTIIFFSEKFISGETLTSWRQSFDNIAQVVTIDTSNRGFNGGVTRYGYKYMCKFFALGKYRIVS